MGDHVGTPDVEFLFLFLFASPGVVCVCSVCVDFVVVCVLSVFPVVGEFLFCCELGSRQASKRGKQATKERAI